MAFASSFLRLVGLRPTGDEVSPLREVSPLEDSVDVEPRPLTAGGQIRIPRHPAAIASPLPDVMVETMGLDPAYDRDDFISPAAPGLADIQAAIALVEGGLSSHVLLVGLRAWPGLLWEASRLAREADVEILATTAYGNGRVDLEISRGASGGG